MFGLGWLRVRVRPKGGEGGPVIDPPITSNDPIYLMWLQMWFGCRIVYCTIRVTEGDGVVTVSRHTWCGVHMLTVPLFSVSDSNDSFAASGLQTFLGIEEESLHPSDVLVCMGCDLPYHLCYAMLCWAVLCWPGLSAVLTAVLCCDITRLCCLFVFVCCLSCCARLHGTVHISYCTF